MRSPRHAAPSPLFLFIPLVAAYALDPTLPVNSASLRMTEH